jgi:oxygen-independent coproporphyrinogen-3 oxidase
VVERDLQHPLRADVPAHPLSGDGPDAAARDASRAGLYVHVPFCAVRCTYCHFSTATFEHGLVERWLDALEREAALRAPLARGVPLTSLFFGGGTPSAISARHFERLARVLSAHFEFAPGAEITLEANPESVKPALLEAWARAGVNRLSMGAQSFEPFELEVLGRIHDRARPLEAVALARAHGFTRLSLDLMFGYPGHTLAAFERSLAQAFALPIEHLSAYCFIPDRGNPLGDAVLDGRASVVADDDQAGMYAAFLAAAERAGMRPYETSNVCRPGAEARHNLTYWLRRDCMALGPSAHGLWRDERWGNLRGTHEWATALEAGLPPESERETPGERATSEEIVMLALRLGSGLRLADYAPRARAALERRFGGALAEAVAGGRLEATADGWRIAPAHRFVADDVIAWVASRGRN